MQQVKVYEFGPPGNLVLEDVPTPEPGPGQVRVRLTSIGMNYAELMGRQGYYRASTGDPPFTPGIEGGGVVDAVGRGVDASRIGQRVTLGPDVPRGVAGPQGGTYRSHVVVNAATALPAPERIPDDQLGAVILPYFTAWGCLVHHHGIKPGDIVGIPAASSSVGLAAAQVVKHFGAVPIGLTSSPQKVDAIRALDTNAFEHLVVTHDRNNDQRVMRPWHSDIKRITDGHGVDVFFDPVAAGEYLSTEIRCLATGGTIYIYGLLGEPGPVDMSYMLIKQATMRGWMLYELVTAGESVWRPITEAIFDAFRSGVFRQQLAATFRLGEVQKAHEQMERGEHIGKLVLIPDGTG